MRDEINEDIDYGDDEDSKVDADTSLADLDISRLANINNDVNTAKVEINNENEPSMFAASNLFMKTADNLARAEAMVDDKPMRTEKTAELERKEDEDEEDRHQKRK